MFFLLIACTPEHDPSGADADSVQLPPPQLIPLPQTLNIGEGSFTLESDTTIGATGDAAAVGEQLAEYLRIPTGFALPVGDSGEISLELVDGLPPEGYTLDVSADGARIEAIDSAGLFYGIQTLRQLLPADIYGAQSQAEWVLPTVHIEDSPRFAWRGGMIDVARHFFTVIEIERQIDLMAIHKLNRLHLHLTDDQGWRIEIKSWPNLAIWGGGSEVGGGPGGYYSQEEFGALVKYAAARHVVIIPEIDFPGHANAALASYAELNESGFAAERYTGEGVISTPLWLDGPDTAQFVSDVWSEVSAMSPDAVVHIGGDEAIDTSAADYRKFIQALQQTLSENQKTLLGWDEVGTVPLATPFLAQYWYEPENARDAVAQGGQLIVSPAEFAYLDMVQSPSADYGQVWAGVIDTEQAYSWDPVLEGTAESDIIGVEGCLWTEYIDDQEKMDFMLWPRLSALSEVGWSNQRDWTSFAQRLAYDGARFDELGVGYYRDPAIEWLGFE